MTERDAGVEATDADTSSLRRYRTPVDVIFIPVIATLALVVSVVQCNTSSGERDELKQQLTLQVRQIELLEERLLQDEESFSELRRRNDIQQMAIQAEREENALLETQVEGQEKQTRAIEELRRLRLGDPSFSFASVPAANEWSPSQPAFEIRNKGGFVYNEEWTELNSLVLILGAWETPDRNRCLGTPVSVPMRPGLWEWRFEGGSAASELFLRARTDSWSRFQDVQPLLHHELSGYNYCLGLMWETWIKIEYRTYANRDSGRIDTLYLWVHPTEGSGSEVVVEPIKANEWERVLADRNRMMSFERLVVAANPHHLLDLAADLQNELPR